MSDILTTNSRPSQDPSFDETLSVRGEPLRFMFRSFAQMYVRTFWNHTEKMGEANTKPFDGLL